MKLILLSLAIIICVSAFSQPQERRTDIFGSNISERQETDRWEKSNRQNPTITSNARHFSDFSTEKLRLDSMTSSAGMKTIFVYDNYNRVISETDYEFQWSSNSWVALGMSEFTYHDNGNLAILTYWHIENNFKREYTYNSDGNLVTVIVIEQGYYTTKREYIYNDYGNLVTEINFWWVDNAWVSSSRREHTYDSNGNLTTIIGYTWSNNSWRNNFKEEFTYDNNGNLVTIIMYLWENNSWINSSRTEYTYDSNGSLITLMGYFWCTYNDTWENRWRDEYTYDSNGNLTSLVEYRWQDNTWRESGSRTNTYDNNGNLITQIEINWWQNEPSGWKVELVRDLSYSVSDIILLPPNNIFDYFPGSNKIIRANQYHGGGGSNMWTPERTIIFHYSGVTPNSLITPEVNPDRNPVAFYSIMGVRLRSAPERGIYIVVYCDGSTEKRAR